MEAAADDELEGVDDDDEEDEEDEGKRGGLRENVSVEPVSLVSVREENLGVLRNLNSVLFPINYQQRYYAHVLSSGDFSKLGSKLMKHVLGQCEQDQDISDMYLHVQVNNDEAIKFYKKFDFEIRDTIRNYYKRIDPPDCYILSKNLHTWGMPSYSDGRFSASE